MQWEETQWKRSRQNFKRIDMFQATNGYWEKIIYIDFKFNCPTYDKYDQSKWTIIYWSCQRNAAAARHMCMLMYEILSARLLYGIEDRVWLLYWAFLQNENVIGTSHVCIFVNTRSFQDVSERCLNRLYAYLSIFLANHICRFLKFIYFQPIKYIISIYSSIEMQQSCCHLSLRMCISHHFNAIKLLIMSNNMICSKSRSLTFIKSANPINFLDQLFPNHNNICFWLFELTDDKSSNFTLCYWKYFVCNFNFKHVLCSCILH